MELTIEKTRLENEIKNLHSELKRANAKCDSQQNEIQHLGEQLDAAMQGDGISQNQTLITLKTELANSLKSEYENYLSDRDLDYNPDTYESFRGSLTRIFRALKRFEIID